MKASLLCAVLVLFGAGLIHGQTVTVVKFARGATSATYTGKIVGYKYADYNLVAHAGQTMEVKAVSDNAGLETVLFDRGMNNVEGVPPSPDWSVTLPDDGKYTIRVLLVRSAARKKGAHATYSLTISVN
jgi:hypothetical protein